MSAADTCVRCNHERAGHKKLLGGICIGCPCAGFQSPMEAQVERLENDLAEAHALLRLCRDIFAKSPVAPSAADRARIDAALKVES